MNRNLQGALLPGALVFALAVVAVGCGERKDAGGGQVASTAAAPGSPAVEFAHLNEGPRAAESGHGEDAEASAGEVLFKTKGCSACHAFGRRVTGPDLNGVTQRRTEAWIQSQILHPEEMVKNDSTSHALFAVYAVQMPNLHLLPGDARALLTYFEHQDRKSSDKH